LSEQDAAKGIAAFRAKQPNAPKPSDKFSVEYWKVEDSCHFDYVEVDQPTMEHGRIMFTLNDRGEVVDISMPRVLPAGSFVCPDMNIEADMFSKKIQAMRGDRTILVPAKPAKAKESLSLKDCVYVFEELLENRKNVWEGNRFYFDFRGDLIYFTPKRKK
jgi:hypothetical protein